MLLMREGVPSPQLVSTPLYEQLLAFVRRRLGPGAEGEDLVQQILLKVLQADLPNGDRFAPWLFRVAHNAVIDVYRARGRVAMRDRLLSWEGQPCDDGRAHTLEAQNESTEIARYLVTLVERLDEPDRQALLQVDLGGRTQREFAREQELSYSTAKSRVQRARRRLRRELEAHCALEFDGRNRPIRCTPKVPHCCQ